MVRTGPPAPSTHVWWADLTAAGTHLLPLLPAAERARVEELDRPADRGRRLVGAALLQHAVRHARQERGQTVDLPPTAPVGVDRTCAVCGAPHGRPVVEGGPSVSVAHAGLLILVATCWERPVGVDVEALGRAPDPHAWVRQEARVKARGSSLAPSLGGTAGADLPVVDLTPPRPGYAAALAGAVDGVHVHRWITTPRG